MSDPSSAVHNEKDVITEKKFPYKILNDLAKKLKAAEGVIIEERKFYKDKIAEMRDNFEHNRYYQTTSEVYKQPIEVTEDAKDDKIFKLKQRIAEFVFENNRYHLSIFYCTVCTSDDGFSDASLSNVSIKASTPVTASLDTLGPSSISPVPCSSVSSSGVPALSSTVPALLPGSVVKGRKQTNTVVGRTRPSSTGW